MKPDARCHTFVYLRRVYAGFSWIHYHFYLFDGVAHTLKYRDAVEYSVPATGGYYDNSGPAYPEAGD